MENMPRLDLPRTVQVEDIELQAGKFVGVAGGKVIRHWHDETETIHLFLVMSADAQEREVVMFSLNGPVPMEVGYSLQEAFLGGSVSVGMNIAMAKGLPSGVIITNARGVIDGTHIVLN